MQSCPFSSVPNLVFFHSFALLSLLIKLLPLLCLVTFCLSLYSPLPFPHSTFFLSSAFLAQPYLSFAFLTVIFLFLAPYFYLLQPSLPFFIFHLLPSFFILLPSTGFVSLPFLPFPFLTLVLLLAHTLPFPIRRCFSPSLSILLHVNLPFLSSLTVHPLPSLAFSFPLLTFLFSHTVFPCTIILPCPPLQSCLFPSHYSHIFCSPPHFCLPSLAKPHPALFSRLLQAASGPRGGVRCRSSCHRHRRGVLLPLFLLSAVQEAPAY